ncbi:MepB family protein [Streptomyces sp. SID3343]|uniref:MepB family protein n=1 Tax=Streptomyces sp. SID3343 TaxID=2690260 RepID=UPI001371D74B|nr:MepB family protein [Streptomyces sp. SID3343]MYW02730.1 MepB domain containing protein [Streptomyces sp. SID3343]
MTTHRNAAVDTEEPWGVGTPGGPGAAVHRDLVAARALVYDPAGFVCSRPVAEAESAEYGAYELTVDGRSVRFRVAKTTPTKVGGFVTVWQRSEAGPIRPFDAGDAVDLFVVSARDGGGRFGQFVFPCEVLRERDIVSTAGVGGKRGFRVYPPWVVTANPQARRTQTWQLGHFLSFGADAPVNAARARALYRA